MSEWIKAAYQLPEEGVDVLATDGKDVCVLVYEVYTTRGDTGFGLPSYWDIEEGYHCLGTITHWMPLSPLPPIDPNFDI